MPSRRAWNWAAAHVRRFGYRPGTERKGAIGWVDIGS